jgi:uncharacterized protein involved in exopolysaccharide biosynthesis
MVIAALVALGSVAGYAVANFVPKQYTSQTVVLVQQPTVTGDYVKPVVAEATSQRLVTMQQEIMSRSRLEPIIKKLGLYAEEIDKVPMEDLVARLREAIAVAPLPTMADTRAQGLPGFNVSVTFDDPRLAQAICHAITTQFTEQNIMQRQRQSEQTTQFLGGQLDEATPSLPNFSDGFSARYRRTDRRT